LIRTCIPEYLVGDLLEQYNQNLAHQGPLSAKIVLFKECASLLWGGLWRGICRLIGVDLIVRFFRNG
jgi:hypothetical protein